MSQWNEVWGKKPDSNPWDKRGIETRKACKEGGQEKHERECRGFGNLGKGNKPRKT